MGKIKGIEITDLKVGTGAEATKEDNVAVNVRMFLRRGDEVTYSPGFGPRMIIDLSRRECIAGLLKGIPGMRVGGIRQILISQHLAYGEAGISGRIPANALLRCEVELLAIRDHSALLPEDYLPGKLLRITHLANRKARSSNWTIEIHESGNCNLHFSARDLVSPRWSLVPMTLDPRKAGSFIQQALDAPSQLPDDCIPWGSSRLETPIRSQQISDKTTQLICIVVNVMERNQRVLDYAVPESSLNFLQSSFFETLGALIKPHLDPPIESALQP